MRDLIDREAAIDAIYHHFPGKSREECAMILHEVPSQPERKKGKWEWDAEEGYWCSECKEYAYGCTGEIMEGSYKFCPFCGSENEEDQWTEEEQ